MIRETVLKTGYLFFICALSGQLSFASVVEKEPNSTPYVSVNIEVKELNDAAEVIKKASLKLANSLNHTSDNVNNLSPEQLVALAELIRQLDEVITHVDSSINALPDTISASQEPGLTFVRGAMETVQAHTITPLTQAAQRGLWWLLTGLTVIVLILIAGLFFCVTRLNSLGDAMIRITESYRVIPKEQYLSSLAKGGEDSLKRDPQG